LFNIKTIQVPTQNVLAALVWEAALCFSLPTWMLSANQAWPANNTFSFAFAVLAGATTSLLLCHILPAVFAEHLAGRQPGIMRAFGWMANAWFAIGAAASAIWLARSLAEWFWRSQPDSNLLVGLSAVGALLLAVLVTQAPPRWQMTVAAVLGLLGLIVILISAISQARGLWMVTPQLRSEDALGNDFEVFKGILLASAPASIFAFRVGKSGPTRRAIAWTGLWAIWLPVVLSVALVALAKMGGVRLYWRPSAVIDVAFAFIWLSKIFRINFFVPLIILSLVSMIAPVFWISDHLRGATLPRRLLALITAGAIGLWLTFPDGAVILGYHLPLFVDEFSFQGYYLPWCWSILIASVAYGCWMALMGLIAGARKLFSQA
jgi:hypothetical protein